VPPSLSTGSRGPVHRTVYAYPLYADRTVHLTASGQSVRCTVLAACSLFIAANSLSATRNSPSFVAAHLVDASLIVRDTRAQDRAAGAYHENNVSFA